MNKNDVTIVMPVSILPSHPNIWILEETIKSVRFHFPKNEIILQIDGLRSERKNRKNDYDEFKNRVLWKCLHEWDNVLPIIFDEHSHQTTMMKKTIGEIKTSLMLYVESDAPLVTDIDINWEECLDMLEYGKAKTIRFHFEAFIPEPAVKTFYVGVLNRLAGSDEIELYAVAVGPRVHLLGEELRTVVDRDNPGQSPGGRQTVENRRNPAGRQREVSLDCEALPSEHIYDR